MLQTEIQGAGVKKWQQRPEDYLKILSLTKKLGMLKRRIRDLAQENAKLKKEMNHESVRQKDNVARMYLEFFKRQQLAFEQA